MSGRFIAGAVPFVIWGSMAAVAPEAPSTTKYRIDTKLEQIVDLSAMGQGAHGYDRRADHARRDR